MRPRIESFIGESAIDNTGASVRDVEAQAMRASEAMGNIRTGRNLEPAYAIALDAIQELRGKTELDEREARLLSDSRAVLQKAFGGYVNTVSSTWEEFRKRRESQQHTSHQKRQGWFFSISW